MINAKPVAAPAAASIAANDSRQAPRIGPPRMIAQPVPHDIGIALFMRGRRRVDRCDHRDDRSAMAAESPPVGNS